MKKNEGFTLVELLVVIGLIGVLASVVLVGITTVRSKARDAQRRADIRQIQTALELYYADFKQYPASGGAVSPNNGWNTSTDTSWDTLATALRPYLKTLPHDPLEDPDGWPGSNQAISYYSRAYGCPQKWYMIVYRLENSKGPDAGVTACDGTFFQYGGTGTSTVVKTVGGQSKQ